MSAFRQVLAAAILAAACAFAFQLPAYASPEDPPGEPQLEVDEEADEADAFVPAVSSFFFDTRSLFDLVNSTLTAVVSRSYAQIIPQWEQPLNFALLFTVSYSADGLEQVRGLDGRVNLAEKIYPYWHVSLSVAAAFFPLILIANIAQVYTSGSSAPVARAEMLSSVVFALLRFAFVASSWWAANTVIKISWGLAQQLAEVGIGPSGREIAALLTRLVLKTTLSSLVRPGTALLIFYLLLFVFLLTILLVTALALSHYAFIALSAIFIVLAPIVIAVGALPFFGWLYGTWIKTVSGILLLPVANVLILKLAFTILPLEAGVSIVRLATALGVIGVLVSVNFTIAKSVYGPVLQAAKMAGRSVVGLGKLAGSLALAGAPAAGLTSAAGSLLGGKGIAGKGSGLEAGATNLLSGAIPSTPSAAPPARPASSLSTLANSAASSRASSPAGENGRTSLANRDPLLRGAMGAWTPPAQAANPSGIPREQSPASPAIPWNQDRVRQLLKPANPARADAMYGWAQETFSSSRGPFYPEIRAKVGTPGFDRHFEGLLSGTAAAHADVQPLLDGSPQSAWVVPGMGRAEAVEAIGQAGAFFGGEVETFSRAIAAQHESGAQYIGDFSTHSIHAYIRGVINRFTRQD